MEAVVAKGDEVSWHVEKLSWTGVYDVTTERRVIGTLDEGNNVQLGEKYGGGTISLDEARAIAERTAYLGQGSSTAVTITGSIARALHGGRSADSDGAPSMLGSATRSLGNDYVQIQTHAVRMVTDPKYAVENIANTASAMYQEATYVEREYGYNRWSYLAGEISGANTFAEGFESVDVPRCQFIDGVESVSRMAIGGGQLVGTGTVGYAGATALANKVLPASSALRTNLVGRAGPVAPRVVATETTATSPQGLINGTTNGYTGSRTAVGRPKGGAGPVRVGQAGERAVGISGPKTRIRVNGRLRIPERITPSTLTEVKNVKSLSNTAQLRDYSQYARQTGKTFELYVRSDAYLSGPLREAAHMGEIIIKTIPGM